MDGELLTLMVTPAVLISASALMVLSTTNRYARVIDRIREISHTLEQLLRGQPSADDPHRKQLLRGQPSADDPHREQRIEHARWQIDTLRRRGHLLNRAMQAFVAAVAAFIVASLSTVISFTLMRHSIVLPLSLVMAGMLSLLLGAQCLMRELRISFAVTEDEVEFVLTRKRGSASEHRRKEPS